jgi:hypothetical protein
MELSYSDDFLWTIFYSLMDVEDNFLQLFFRNMLKKAIVKDKYD